jgi:hypothetical protein
MAGNSLIKYIHSREQDRIEAHQPLQWGRIEEDGLPFRGPSVPMLRNEEYEDRLVRVADAKNGTFFTGDPVQNRAYLQIMDRCANGWYRPIYVERWREPGIPQHYIYLEWVELFMEDGSPVRARQSDALPLLNMMPPQAGGY